MAQPKMSKNQMRRAKKKEQKKVKVEALAQDTIPQDNEDVPEGLDVKDETNVNEEPAKAPKQQSTQPVQIDDEYDEDPAFAMYKNILNKFGSIEETEVTREANAGNQGELFLSDDDIPDEESENESPPRLSKKKRKQMNKLSVAELKALVNIPEVVEWQDVSSSDPRMLVQIKAQRNVVPVPNHWALKREYLSSKRGIEKSAFSLPKFIAETGITEMRDAVLEKQAEQSLRQKQRERVQGKLGKLDIDYQKLYDAFFKFQEKPELTRFGEVYYEGKESEVDYQHFRPGELSDMTKEALGMPPGAPPPWLVSQQRLGPPPTYSTLKVPGLNAPPPPGGSWGFHPGGWGKPPVDEFNRPLYGGDVFGVATGATTTNAAPQAVGPVHSGEPVEKQLWGELQPRAEESEEEEDDDDDSDDDEDADEEDVPGGLETPSGMETPAGYASTVHPEGGIETDIAGEMELRKDVRRGYDTEDSSAPRSAYTVLPERQVRAEGFFGSDRVYDLPSQNNNNNNNKNKSSGPSVPVLGQDDESRKRKKPGDIDASLDLDALQAHDGIDKEELQRRFEQGRKDEGPGNQWNYDDDLSEMIAEESRKRQRTEKGHGDKKRESRW